MKNSISSLAHFLDSNDPPEEVCLMFYTLDVNHDVALSIQVLGQYLHSYFLYSGLKYNAVQICIQLVGINNQKLS